MREYKLFMDVSGDVAQEIADKSGVKLVPMDFVIGNETYTYTDRSDGIAPVDFYKYVKDRVHISTTQITPTYYEEFFDETLKQGYSVLYLCLSSGLSSTYDSACNAAKSLKEKYPNVDFVPVNSLQATVGMGLLCERMIENKQKGMSLEENRDNLLEMRSHITTTGVIDDLEALQRGGRISKTVAVIGGLLNFKPVILVNPNGTLKMSTTVHGIKKSLRYMFELYQSTHDPESNVLYIMHADEEKNSSLLEDMFKAEFPNLQIRRRMLSPIIGAHLGSGLVGIGFLKKD